MERIKIYAASAVFIALTAMKLLFPANAEALREQIFEIIDHNDDYAAMVQTLGRKISEGRLGNELVEALGIEREQEGKRKAAETAILNTEMKSGAVEQVTTPPEPTESMMSEAEEAFLEEQAQYGEQAVPANVRTDMPEIPFEYVCPVAGHDSSGFGYRVHPIDGELRFHYGTDFAANSGDDICAFADGYVYAAGCSEGYGNYIILTHEGGYSTIYAHMSEFVAKEGDMVKRGQLIGRVGQTGKATGPHLHFELLCDDVYVNPEYYI